MITKQQLIDSLVFDCAIIKHLGTKITPELLEYRPAPGMRSTIELMRYLSHVASGSLRGMIQNDWDSTKRRAQADTITLSNFGAAMDAQAEEIKSLLAEVSENDLLTKEIQFPWGGSGVLGISVVNTALKFLSAYKMQLFVYAKSQGIGPLVTSNVWRGADAPKA